ncbi:MAG: hypothetical protein OXK78_15525 [Caldilineaceae bacterium]|nr:hypothetical protein [Caldilineaceae bacterium]
MTEVGTESGPRPVPGVDLAGSVPVFGSRPGSQLVDGESFADFSRKRLIFGSFTRLGETHVYRVDCTAGDRLRAQMFVPVLPRGGSVVPSFAIVARSLPYSADAEKLPLELPHGYSAIVAPPPSELLQPVKDVLTRVHYFPGPLIDSRTLVGGRCYLVVWTPHNRMGKYVISIGHRWHLRWSYWAQLPLYWWRIRGWFGLSRTAALYVLAGVLLVVLAVAAILRRMGTKRRKTEVKAVDAR